MYIHTQVHVSSTPTMTQVGSVSVILLCVPASFPTQSGQQTCNPSCSNNGEVDREPALMEEILARSEDPGVAVIKS